MKPGRAILPREWLVTNGLGGYASQTVFGQATRRYHAILVAALPSPNGRVVALNQIEEEVPSGSAWVPFDENLLEEFTLERGLPVWRWRLPNGALVEKRLIMPYRQNATILRWTLVGGDFASLRLTPWIHMRLHEEPVAARPRDGYRATERPNGIEIEGTSPFPNVRLAWSGQALVSKRPQARREVMYEMEEARGYVHRGTLRSSFSLSVELRAKESFSIVASVEPWDAILAIRPDEAFAAEWARRDRLVARAEPRDAIEAQLVLAADQFIIDPVARSSDRTRMHAAGEESRSVIAGYHWFTDWGRDTMIALEGLTLATNRAREAGSILRMFAMAVRNGLIPNHFPEGEEEGVYHTADATLWLFHALGRYLDATGDRATLRRLLPSLREVVVRHFEGTDFGIGVDPADGLLRQGSREAPLTWMDARYGEHIVTPRRGKAVEINALFYDALRHYESWVRGEGETAEAEEIATRAERLRRSFNERFWYADGPWLFDVVDGENGSDPALRPNQLFAISLAHPVLDEARWSTVLEAVRADLLTPMGLRTLSPGDEAYQRDYHGDRETRDAAYHQGTVWPWLLGAWVDASLRVDPGSPSDLERTLDGVIQHLWYAGVGTISEVFDAEPPYEAHGCIAQAWSVAEILRARRKLRRVIPSVARDQGRVGNP
ncbi:MAG: amylo-alpha-1,6-glucosidase [Thermoanaerobaculia bacterium]